MLLTTHSMSLCNNRLGIKIHSFIYYLANKVHRVILGSSNYIFGIKQASTVASFGRYNSDHFITESSVYLHIYAENGYRAVVLLDDMASAENWDRVDEADEALGELLKKTVA